MRSAFLDAVTADDVRALARSLLAQALAGDTAAAGLFLSYAVGRPKTAPDPDRADLDELGILAAGPTKAKVTALLLDAVEPSAAAELVRGVLAASPDEVLGQVREFLRLPGAAGLLDAERAGK